MARSTMEAGLNRTLAIRSFVGGFAITVLCFFVTAQPALADGGPHVVTINDGSGGMNADSCAGCHRIHTSQDTSGFLLAPPSNGINSFCLTCHGSTGAGAATNVADGVQYALAGTKYFARTDATQGSGAVIGALRGGGFVKARIGSSSGYRIRTSIELTREFAAKVPVGPAKSVTSAHVAVTGSGVSANGIAWGYGGPALSNPGPTFSGGLKCTSCHNPHGNGNYRILESQPTDDVSVKPIAVATVWDSPLPSSGDTRNYTVIQTKGTVGDLSSFLLYASQLGSVSASAGDYWHRTVPWDLAWNSTSGMADAPNGAPANGFIGTTFVKAFNSEMTAWCTQCHTRYLNVDTSSDPSGDGIFAYRHATGVRRTACTTCHVAHGSNALMNTEVSQGTTFSANQPFPGSSTVLPSQVGDSRLLKMDGRGTCLGCHDPTGNLKVGGTSGTPPSPYLP